MANGKRKYGSNFVSDGRRTGQKRITLKMPAFFRGLHTYGRLDSTEKQELMSITIKYFESMEEPQKGNSKKLRLWAFRRMPRNTGER